MYMSKSECNYVNGSIFTFPTHRYMYLINKNTEIIKKREKEKVCNAVSLNYFYMHNGNVDLCVT